MTSANEEEFATYSFVPSFESARPRGPEPMKIKFSTASVLRLMIATELDDGTVA